MNTETEPEKQIIEIFFFKYQNMNEFLGELYTAVHSMSTYILYAFSISKNTAMTVSLQIWAFLMSDSRQALHPL